MNIIERSPKITARIAGLIYVVVFSLGIFSLFLVIPSVRSRDD
jgi:hypothetical protein